MEVVPVHPVEVSPDGELLAVCHTADNRVLVYSLVSGVPVLAGAVATGSDPVSVRWRTAGDLWVVNQTSDSVSVVDVGRRLVRQTLQTADEPADVVFAGTPPRAWVSCSQVNRVQVFDALNPAAGVPGEVVIEGEEPRALAVSGDGMKVYVAIFESGNSTTILAGGGDGDTISFPPNAVSDPRGPYGGVNPPPNRGTAFFPPLNPAAGPPPNVGLIVRKDAGGAWFDDNNRNWTPLVNGALAAGSGRIPGWDVIDHDVAVIDTATLGVTYAGRMMNLCMALAVNPVSGRVSLVGTEATNEVRFEPNLNGRFLRVRLGAFDPAAPAATATVDLNPHLTYEVATVPEAERNKSLGDPRAIVWQEDGTRGFVAGMGSNNVIAIDASGARVFADPIEVGQGPAGLALDERRGRLYVLNRFEASLSVIDLATQSEIQRQPFFDPTPAAIKSGRPFLYDTRRTSGLGHTSCASCHADARTDRLAWDLGDPSGVVKEVKASRHNLGGNFPGLNTNFTDFHPMKGPMTTQTLQDIIGKEPHHWRGDRDGIEEFNGAFVGLLGDDAPLTAAEMQQFEDFLATVAIPPNPHRNLDNSLPTEVPLPGHYSTGRFPSTPEGGPMPPGNPARALITLYRPITRGIDRGAFACVTCHALPTGMGTDSRVSGLAFTGIPPGSSGERHHALVSVDGSSQRAFKTPQLRTLGDKTGFELRQPRSLSGFGFLHDGSVDSLTRFFSEEAFDPNNIQEVADLVSLMLCFSGSGFGAALDFFEPPGTPSLDVPAAVGRQAHLVSPSLPAADKARLDTLLALAGAQSIDLVAKASVNGEPRGWHFQAVGGYFQSDQAGVGEPLAAILGRATADEPVVFTATALGTGRRLGIERDRDGLLDYDETRDLAPSLSGVQNPFRSDAPDSTGNDYSLEPDGILDGTNDFDGDGATNLAEFTAGTNPIDGWQGAMDIPLALDRSGDPTTATLHWMAAPYAVYEIRWSNDLVAWSPLATGSLDAGPTGGLMSWTDHGPPDTTDSSATAPRRFYKIERVR
ncbi:MAG: YncE family protein [Verrucomicrobiales bacterium]